MPLGHINVEFKARCTNPQAVRDILISKGAVYKGKDHQVDVYFKVPHGRLKLRKGIIENNLIAYEREDYAGAKESKVILVKSEQPDYLEEALAKTLGVKVVVDKKRDIYFIDNVKFHVDDVQALGSFIEVEALDQNGTIGRDKLQEQCDYYKALLGVQDADIIAVSYSDMLNEQH
jgi:predicted adenylyl cyclase CyaB